MFIFQACYGMAKYGMPEDLYEDVQITGCVKSHSSNEPIKGIKVQVHESEYGDFTDENGEFSFYSPRYSNDYYSCGGSYNFPIVFKDVDGDENGSYADSTFMVNVYGQHEVTINILLKEKE
jgi:hypothetical protein